MRKFGRRFEVKNEMSDAGKIQSDDMGGEISESVKKEYFKEANQVGFSDEEVFETKSTEILDIVKEEYYAQNRLVHEELAKYFNEDISNEYLQAYLTEKIDAI